MGYYMDMRDRNFEIKKENIPAALQALKDYAKNKNHIPWVNIKAVLSAETFKEAMNELRYAIEFDSESGNIIDIVHILVR